MRCFGGERGFDRDGPAGDHTVIQGVAGSEQFVQRRQGGDFRDRDRDEVASAEAADLALDPALLVRALRPSRQKHESKL